jgi:anthranilate phosphoribosyltransferase
MSNPLAQALDLLSRGRDLTSDQAAAAFGVVMRGEAAPLEIKALLLGLKAKGETPEEIAGAAQALRSAMVTVRPGGGTPLVDTCGTGGGTVGTFNISTAAAFVVAAAGSRVAKHGNRSYTSKCGSADVLEALGVDIGLSPERVTEVLNRAGVAFLFAPNYHPAMRHVGPVRKELGVPTVMNLLGPLANPAGVRRQVIGVADSERAPRMAAALARLGVEHAFVVHAEIGMDEISPAGATRIWEIRSGAVSTWSLEPADYGMAWPDPEDLLGGEPAHNAERIERLLGGSSPDDEAGRRAVILNAAAGIYVAGLVGSYAEGIELASRVLAEGRAAVALARLREAARRLDG